MRMLVGYASAHGSTAEIAHRIAGALQRAGWAVDVKAVREIADPGAYDAAVLGSAIHNQAWLPEATEFVRRHQDVLRERPVWFFSVGMSGGLPRPMRKPARAAQDRTLAEALRDVVRPRGHRVFSGAAWQDQFPRSSRMLVRAMGIRFGDYRDGSEIDAWAVDIAEQLARGTSEATGRS
jgi:menaquinone-dependent protoporphyrinogen oxidase